MAGQAVHALKDEMHELGPFSHGSAQATDAGQWRHWRLARGHDDVAWLLLDRSGAGTNTLSAEVLSELGGILDRLEENRPAALVLRSAKADNFCVGADIGEFRELESRAAAVEKLQEAHAVAGRLEALPCPTIAVIHGPCLGGGFELALCCDYRLAVIDATLGFPEVQLGLHPGLGGTARLTHLIDPMEAMTLMLTGKSIDARKARSLGAVDDVVPERHVVAAVEAIVKGELRPHNNGVKARLLTTGFARLYEARQMRSKSAKKAPPQHYPAPEALIALWEEHGSDTEAMRQAEIDSFAELLQTETAQNLIRVFFLRETLKKMGRDERAAPVRHVHVIGAGAMGGDIAAWCAYQGFSVSLFDMDQTMVARAVKGVADLCRRKRLSEAERRRVLDHFMPDLKQVAVRKADLVIEAVPEKIDIKQKVYRDIEPRLKPGAVLATNTSSIPLEQLREVLDEPGRLLGLHFFNPVEKMPLVEVVEHDRATPETLATGRRFVGAIDRLPAPVASAPGFLVNRVLMPYLMEAMLLLDEGATAETIDRSAEDFGMPMGPLELADQVGLDICLGVADMLAERLDAPMAEVPGWLKSRVEEGNLGSKSGRGIYDWKNGHAEKQQNNAEADATIRDRLILPMLNACMACLRERVVDGEDVLDGAMIFGTGFAPFRGGPMHYARRRGLGDVRSRLESFTAEYGYRFQPDPGWSES